MKKIAGIFILAFIFAFCEKANANAILDKNAKSIFKIETYLNSVQYFSADFIQDDNMSNILSEGKFYLARPGKLRLEYMTPSKILLITNNKSTIYYDIELEELDKMPTKRTPLHFLTKNKFNFSDNKEIELVNFEEKENAIMLSVTEKNKKEQGILCFILQKNPMKLIGMKVINELNQEINVVFENIVVNAKLKDELFIFKNPRDDKKLKQRY
jgi:outer membrane lipoprotein-sorting protein